ncbi:protein-disulfide isomerase, contains CxxC motif [Peptoniphilus asaccharolyticus DSM 20463]|uniref:Protein-disulfide isomerase, contains CxxC motif n=1 Tax=Peptoniphilus asaccharolyticus DSM 20463 TaxID=573058 RepID=A0A1W1UV30_PEPAS|nr:DsbA family protein [Peptoniphilus asaccharolyticus]MBL7575221.1 DsbA family protein [Peptoniphilus asaccharolyticus]SMB84900.1 protein-disulfide isomerase, contains CxxC motif [Peptoniphilus asaccharolyticus DSM 20463]
MKIYIFSDVVCTWSWGQEKVLRAIDYLFGNKIEFENIMGGMISDYHDILPMNMKDQDSNETANGILRRIWTAGSTIHKMPVSKDIPNLLSRENPSTNKLDKFFIAARETSSDKANLFLRKLREATIVDGIDTMQVKNIEPLLNEVGIDFEEFLESFEENSNQSFLEDRMSTFDRRLEAFPNFMYVNEKGREFLIKGYKSKEELLNFIFEHSDLKPIEIEQSEENIFDFIKKYKRVFLPEIYELFTDEELVKNTLNNLKENNLVEIKIVGDTKEIKFGSISNIGETC